MINTHGYKTNSISVNVLLTISTQKNVMNDMFKLTLQFTFVS